MIDPDYDEKQLSKFYLFGKSIDQYHPMELRAYISNLDKDSFMMQGTLRENLDPDGILQQEEIMDALIHFDLVGFIVKTIGSAKISDICAFFEGEYKPKLRVE